MVITANGDMLLIRVIKSIREVLLDYLFLECLGTLPGGIRMQAAEQYREYEHGDGIVFIAQAADEPRKILTPESRIGKLFSTYRTR